MGRKPKSTKPEEKSNLNENSNPTLEIMEAEQRSLNNLPSKKKPSKGASSNMNARTRRSGRIRNLKSPVSNQEMIVEEIDLADSEKEEEPPLVQHSNSDLHVQQLNADPHVQQLNSEPHVQQSNSETLVQQSNSEPHVQQLNSELHVQQLNSDPVQHFNTEPISNQHNFEDKIDFLVQSVEEFKSQGTKRPFQSETQSVEINYRSLYIGSQKKIEALTEENHHLVKQLEFAKGQIKAFEQMKDIFGSLKDMMLMSNMTKATEALINLSSQAATGNFALPEATNDGVPLAAGEHQTTSPPTRKKYARKKKKQMEVEKS